MKKNLILAAVFLFAAKIATAQTERGTQNLGLNLSVANQDQTGTQLNYNNYSLYSTSAKTTQLSIGPNYSYFIADKLDLGADLSYSHFYTSESPDAMPEKQVQNSFGGDIFLRKYFMCSDKLGFRAGPYVGYSKMTSNYTYTTPYPGDIDHSTTQSVYGGVKLDLVYYPSKHLGVSATLANAEYSHDKLNNGSVGGNSSNNYSLALLTTGVGISVFYAFGGK